MLEKLSGPVLTGHPSGQNANNNLFRIVMKPGVRHFASILLQERWEQGFKRILLPIHIGIGALAFILSGTWIVGTLAAIASWTFSAMFPPIVRWVEYHGHALEAAHAVKHYGVNREEKEREEAEAMFYGYADYFADVGIEKIEEKLRSLRNWADKIVN